MHAFMLVNRENEATGGVAWIFFPLFTDAPQRSGEH